MARGQGGLSRTMPVAKPAKPVYYRVDRKDGFTGKDKFVDFFGGVGVLDLEAIFLERPDWVEKTESGFVQHSGCQLAEYVTLFQNRGYVLTEIEASEASEIRAAGANERRRAETVQAMKLKASQRLKTRNREDQIPQVLAQIDAQYGRSVPKASAAPIAAKNAADGAADETKSLPAPHEATSEEPKDPDFTEEPEASVEDPTPAPHETPPSTE